jgi:hypothetical protein
MSIETSLKDECVRILSELVPALSRTALSPRADNLAFLASNVLAKLGAELENIARGSVEAEDWAKAVLAGREPKDTERPEAPEPAEALDVWAAAVLDPEEPPTSEAASYVKTVAELDEALGILRREGWQPQAQVLPWGTYNGWPVAQYFGSWRDVRLYIEGTRDGDKWRFRVNIALGLAVELGWRP